MLRKLCLVTLAVCVTQPSWAERVEKRLELEASPFFGGRARLRQWTGVNVEVRNASDRDYEVTLEAWYAGAGYRGIRFQRRVSVPRGAHKRVPIYLLPNNPTRELHVACLNASGKFLAGTSLEVGMIPGAAPHIACIGRPLPGLDRVVFAPAKKGSEEQSRAVLSFIPEEDLPGRTEGLDSVDVLALCSARPDRLSADQALAIEHWVGRGGVLVLAPGHEWQSYKGSVLGDLLPMRLTGMEEAGDGPVRAERFVGTQAWDTLKGLIGGPLVCGEFSGGEAMLTDSGRPLIYRWRQGRGTVLLFTFLPEALFRIGVEEIGRFWAALLQKEWAEPREGKEDANYNAMQMTPPRALTQMLSGRGAREVGVGWLLLIIVAYLLVVGPVDYYLVRKLGRPVLTWVTFPLFVALFSGISYWKAYRLKAGPMQLRQVSVVDLSPVSESQSLRTWTGVYSQQNRDYEISSRESDALWGIGGDEFLAESFTRTAAARQGGPESGIRVRIPIWTMKLIRQESVRAEKWLRPSQVGPDLRIELDPGAPFSLEHWVFVHRGKVYSSRQGLPPGEAVRPEKEGDSTSLAQWQSSASMESRQILQTLYHGWGSTGRHGAQVDGKAIRGMLHLLSFPSKSPENHGGGPVSLASNKFFDLTPALEHGQSVFLGWAGPAVEVTVRDSQPERMELTLMRLVFRAEGGSE